MEMLILWGVPVLTALRGLNRRLFHSYLTFCNLLFSVYVALWSESAISKFYSLPAEAAAFKPAVSMLVAAFVTFLVLYKVVEQLHPETQREFSFPRPIDKLGGGVCGFLFGFCLCLFFLSLFLFRLYLLVLKSVLCFHKNSEDDEDAEGGEEEVYYGLDPCAPEDRVFGGDDIACLVNHCL